MESLVNDQLFGGIYKNKKVFITGHTGFKGSWLACWLKALGATVRGYSLEAPTSPSHWGILNLDCDSVICDIRNGEALTSSMQSFKPDIVFHLAAQPLVRKSYSDPIETFETNVMGSLKLYEAVRKTTSVRAVISVTTDKVYENKEWSWPYRENDRLGGKDPYSASKAAMEIMTSSYGHSFFNPNTYGKAHQVLLATVRAGNVIGGGDWAQDRLIPDIIQSVQNAQAVSIRSPKSIRPWQHVLDPLSGYLLLGEKLLNGEQKFAESFNFGPQANEEMNVEQVVKNIKLSWNKVEYKPEAPKENLHESEILKLDCSKALSLLGWKPVWGTKEAIEKAVSWYRRYYEEDKITTTHDLLCYVKNAKELHAIWAN